MKIKFTAAAIASAALLFNIAQAADGTINFTGNITDQACTVDTASANQTVNLGNVSAKAFAAAGDVAAPTKFSINLTNCPQTVTQARVKFDGTTNSTNQTILALSSGQTATNVGVALYEADSTTQIPVASASASQTITTVGPNVLNFVAKYMATTASVGTGTANAVTNFTVNYN